MYDFDLVHNRDFYAWSIEPHDGMGPLPEDQDSKKQIAWDDEMHSFFGYPLSKGGFVNLEPLISVESMRKALAVLYWYRVGLGFEYPIMLRVYYPPPELYMMCSQET